MIFLRRHPKATLDHMGLLPDFLRDDDPRRASEQINEHYAHGGGWCPQPGFTLLKGDVLKYPGDPPLHPIAELRLRLERIVLYEHDVVAIIQLDGSFEVCRVD